MAVLVYSVILLFDTRKVPYILVLGLAGAVGAWMTL